MLCIRKPDEPIDLFMVEIMHMRHKFDVDTRLVCLSNFVLVMCHLHMLEVLSCVQECHEL